MEERKNLLSDLLLHRRRGALARCSSAGTEGVIAVVLHGGPLEKHPAMEPRLLVPVEVRKAGGRVYSLTGASGTSGFAFSRESAYLAAMREQEYVKSVCAVPSAVGLGLLSTMAWSTMLHSGSDQFWRRD